MSLPLPSKNSMQSTAVEIVFWVIVWVLYAAILSKLVRNVFRKLPIWTLANKREGVFCGNGRDDSVMLFVFGLHHGICGLLMWLGIRNDNPALFRNGYLFEAGFEVGDLFSMAWPLYPYKYDGIKNEIKLGMVFHHVSSPFVSENINPH